MDDRKTVSIIAFVIVAALIGGLVHNPYDPVRYGKGAIGVLQGQNIYIFPGIVYPPLFYILSSIVIYPIYILNGISAESYPVIGAFVGIGATVQALSYLLGDRIISDTYSKEWAIASLINPFVIYVVLLFGQMESFVVLGIVGVIYAEYTEQWEIGGALLMVAASVKIFPAILFLPFLWHNRENAYRIMRGAAPVGIVTSLLMIPFLPESLTIVSSSLYGIRPVNALYIFSLTLVPGRVASVVFIGTFMLSGLISIMITSDGYIRYLIPLVPVVLFYPDVIEYRWLPLAVGTLLIGYLPERSDSRLYKQYGWLWVLLGTAAMMIGTVEGWYEGDPWLVPTFGTLPGLPPIVEQWNSNVSVARLIRVVRLGVAFIFIISVLNWCRLIRSRIETFSG